MNMLTDPMRFGSGQAVARIEDEGLLRGQGKFTDDVRPANQAQLVFMRSPYPHANITAIDASQARAMPGVLLVLTGADLVAAGVKPLAGAGGFKRPDGSPCASPDRRALAHERVRFVGEAVAAVVATTLQQAKDAAEAIQVDYHDLPMAVAMDDALAPGAPALCEAAPDNICAESRYGDAPACASAFAQAAHVVALAITNQRLAAVTLEPRTVLAEFDAASQRLTLRMCSQMPTGARAAVCDALGLQTEQVRVLVGDVGGGFGMKTGAYPEDVVTAYCARALQSPVKWVAERGEEFLSTTHGRDVQS